MAKTGRKGTRIRLICVKSLVYWWTVSSFVTIVAPDFGAKEPIMDFNVDKKLCKFCQSEISAKAVKCPNCAEWLSRKAKPWNPLIAFFLSIAIPGLGMWYRNAFGTCAFWFIVVCGVYCIGIGANLPIFVLGGSLLHLLSAIRSVC